MLRNITLALIFAAQGCVAYEPGPTSITIERGQEGRVYFSTIDAYDFPDMVSGQAPMRVIHGDLSLPTGGSPIRGGVILSHGSGGPSSLHARMADWLTGQGLAVFRLDHFGPRGVSSTARDQLKVTAQGMLADAIVARDLLATHPDLDASRIGHMGWSKGGIVALSGAVERFAAYAGAAEPLAFSVAFYPFCNFSFPEDKLATPLLVLIGDADTWTPAVPCKLLVENWRGAGAPAEIEVYPGARHGFDSNALDLDISSAITVRDTSPACTLTVDEQGRTVSLDGAYALTSSDGRIDYLRACGTRGVTYGGQPAARDASFLRIKAFLDENLPDEVD